MKSTHLLLSAPLLLALAACHTSPYRVKQDFRTSANTLLAHQIVAAGEETADLDGNKAEGILETYRTTNNSGAASTNVQLPIGALLEN